jgi:hypothetical protein
MTEADKAIENSIVLELRKDGLQQRQSGDWQLRFTVAAIDMDQRLTQAAMGQRFQCVLVEIGGDELPVDHKARERDKWRDLGPAKQAGMRCRDVLFQTFLRETYPEQWDNLGSVEAEDGEDYAAMFVRDHCRVASRSDLNRPGFSDQRLAWHQLDNQFQAWKAKEHVA